MDATEEEIWAHVVLHPHVHKQERFRLTYILNVPNWFQNKAESKLNVRVSR